MIDRADWKDYECVHCIGKVHEAIMWSRNDVAYCTNCNRPMTLVKHIEKPPIGLRPKIVHDQPRAVEILEAMLRYVEADKAVPQAWLDELKFLSIWKAKDD